MWLAGGAGGGDTHVNKFEQVCSGHMGRTAQFEDKFPRFWTPVIVNLEVSTPKILLFSSRFL